MLHGRLIRPLGQGAYGDGTLTQIVSIDERSIAGLGDARVVRRGDFARRRRLTGVRRDPGGGSAEGRLPQPAADLGQREPLLARCATLDAAGLAPAAHADPGGRRRRGDRRRRRTRSRASYAYHYQGHMPIGPSCAIGDVTATGALVLGNMQDAYGMRVNALGAPRAAREPDQGAVLGGREHVRQQPGPVRRGRGGRGDVPARGRAGAAPVHALGRARLGQLRPGHPRPTCAAGLTARATSSRWTTPRYGIPSISMRSDATTQNVGIPLAPAGLGAGRHDQLGHPVRDPEPPRQRQVDAALGHVLQDLGAARARTARRRASPPSSSSTSSRTPRGSTRTSSGCRTSRRRR